MLDDQFKRLEEKIRKTVVTVAVDVAQNASMSVKMPVTERGAMSPFGSPVDTGLYQKSHNISLNTPESKMGADEDEVTELSNASKSMKLGDTIIITNAVPYAKDLNLAPSPLRKTRGGMYLNAARAAVQFTKSDLPEICKAVGARFAPARTHKIEVKL